MDTYGTAACDKKGNKLTDNYIAAKVTELFDLRPAKIIEKFHLKNPIYEPTAAYGHFGRQPYQKTLKLIRNGKEVEKLVQFFGWELLDSIDKIKSSFDI